MEHRARGAGTPPRRGAVLIPFLLTWSCDGAAPVDSVGPAPASAEGCGTWTSVGEPFVLTWCGGCHSAALPEERRYGAPMEVNFDSLERVREGGTLLANIALGDAPMMPPAGGVPAAERAAMKKWLDCGAPGESHQLQPGSVDDTLRGAGGYFGGAIDKDGALQVYTTYNFQTAQLLTFDTDESGAAWFASFELFDDAGALIGSGDFEPPLPIWPAQEDLQLVSTTSAVWNGEASSEEVEWTVSWSTDPNPDPRIADPLATQVHLSASTGMAHTWWLSETSSFQAEQHAWGEASGFLGHQAVALSSAMPGVGDGSFPIVAYDIWLVRRIEYVLGEGE